MDKPTILIVDDQSENIDILAGILGPNYNLKIATNGENALKIAQSSELLDLILLDIMMPEMDGYEVCQKLKARTLTKEIPVIFLSSRTEASDIVKGFDLGGKDYVTKPFDPAELISRVKTHIGLKKANAEIHQLLNKTITGVAKVFVDLLSISNPTLYSRAMRLSKYANLLCNYLKLENIWQYKIAIIVSQLGIIFLPNDTIDKISTNKELSEKEEMEFIKYQKKGIGLIAKIPRFESISLMIQNSNTEILSDHFNSTSIIKSTPMEIGKRILKLIIDFDNLMLKGISKEEAIELLKQDKKYYDSYLLLGLKNSIKIIESEIVYKSVTINKMNVGMILDEDLMNDKGMVFLKRGTEISVSLLEKILNLAVNKNLEETKEVKVIIIKEI